MMDANQLLNFHPVPTWCNLTTP